MHSTFHTATRVLLGGLAIAAFVVATVSGQAPRQQTPSPGVPPSEANHFIETPAGWVHPVTPWGDPDIQGMFNLSYVGSVPLERCGGGGAGRAPESLTGPPRGGGAAGARGGGRAGGRGGAACDPSVAFVPEEQYQQRLAAAQQATDRHASLIEQGEFGRALQTGVTDPTTPQRQTSLIMDPPDGRLPPLTDEGNRRMLDMRSSWQWYGGEQQAWDHWTDFDSWDRCITRGMPASMFPYRYNNGLQILQAPGYVVLNMEMVHEARIVPVDGRPALSPEIQQWLGESRGRWEGNTLVIETTNIKPGASMTNIGVAGSPQGNRIPTSEQMTITERITRLNDEHVLYEITTEDPVILTRPWTARFPLKEEPTYEWWEYNCHEGNRTIPDYISASRAERAAAAAAADGQGN